MVRNPRGRKTSKRSHRERTTSSRSASNRKTTSRKSQDPAIGSRSATVRAASRNEELEALRTEFRASIDRIREIERRFEDADQATKGAMSRLIRMLGEFNVRLTSVAANVFEVIAMARKSSGASDRPEQKVRPLSGLDGEIRS